MRFIGLLALPLVAVLATPALSDDIKTTDPLIDTFETGSVNPVTDDANAPVVRKKIKTAKVRSVNNVATAEVEFKPRARKFKSGQMWPTGLAF